MVRIIRAYAGIANVGIKPQQKIQIEDIMHEKRNKYSSINEFVQQAVDKLINEEKSEKRKTEIKNADALIVEINMLFEGILEDELEGKIDIASRLKEFFGYVNSDIINFRKALLTRNRSSILLAAIELKMSLEILKSQIKERITIYNPNTGVVRRKCAEILEKYIRKIEHLQKQFAKAVKSANK